MGRSAAGTLRATMFVRVERRRRGEREARTELTVFPTRLCHDGAGSRGGASSSSRGGGEREGGLEVGESRPTSNAPGAGAARGGASWGDDRRGSRRVRSARPGDGSTRSRVGGGGILPDQSAAHPGAEPSKDSEPIGARAWMAAEMSPSAGVLPRARLRLRAGFRISPSRRALVCAWQDGATPHPSCCSDHPVAAERATRSSGNRPDRKRPSGESFLASGGA